MAGACANDEVAIAVANRIVINDVKVFIPACCQLLVPGDKCDQIYLVTDLKFFVVLQSPGRSAGTPRCGTRTARRAVPTQNRCAEKRMNTAIARGNSHGKCIGVICRL